VGTDCEVKKNKIESRKTSWLRRVESMVEINTLKVLVEKPEGKRQLGRPRC
jgi:hypothetical protein